ncbi:MAG TPA: sialidase family protein [Kofleriaceae bacterium]|jgi:hypothetical protein|nr:sialidase family protein [Kofleriaceae bacterium]
MGQRQVLFALALAACGDDGATSADASIDTPPSADASIDAAAPVFEPGLPLLLSADSPNNDEDPAILRARDGSIYVAWFSVSAGNDIMISRTVDGVHWSAPTHVSSGVPADLGPTLYQDSAGIIHAAWFRWPGQQPPGGIVHVAATSPDTINWGSEVNVTTSNATDDWLPTLATNPAGDLVVAFARNTCPPPTCYGLAASTSTDHGATWSTPAPIVAADSTTEHFLPALANTGSELVVAWDPYDHGAQFPFAGITTGSHISLMHSATGATWTNASDITTRQTNSIGTMPTLFADHANVWHVAWLAADSTGARVVERPLDVPSATPVQLPIDGYSPRIVATPTPGVFLAAWVGGADGQRDIYVRVFQ